MSHHRTEIDVVQETEMREVLAQVGVEEIYDQGKLECVNCGRELRSIGLGAVRKIDGSVQFVCPALDCVRSLSEDP